jgi:hypothetical protein
VKFPRARGVIIVRRASGPEAIETPAATVAPTPERFGIMRDDDIAFGQAQVLGKSDDAWPNALIERHPVFNVRQLHSAKAEHASEPALLTVRNRVKEALVCAESGDGTHREPRAARTVPDVATGERAKHCAPSSTSYGRKFSWSSGTLAGWTRDALRGAAAP